MTGDAAPLVGAIFGAAIGFLILFAVVKAAVKSALRDHHEWVAEQKAPPTTP
jgi:hypothetical protein